MQFSFADHTLDIERRELRRGEESIALEPQVFDLLAYLVQSRDRVVSKDDLIATVWGGRIVSDATLSSRIYAGYAVTPLNPEPYAYESAFSVRGLIQQQMAGGKTLPTRNAPAQVSPGHHQNAIIDHTFPVFLRIERQVLVILALQALLAVANDTCDQLGVLVEHQGSAQKDRRGLQIEP